MTPISTKWQLIRATATLLAKNKRAFILFPLPILVSLGVIVLITTLLPTPLDFAHGGHSFFNSVKLSLHDPALYQVTTFSLIYSLFLLEGFISAFINAIFIAYILTYLEGNRPSIHGSFQLAWKAKYKILQWVLLATMMRTVINKLGRLIPGIGGKLIVLLGDLSWGIGTYFVLPLLIFEKKNVLTSIKRSAELVTKNWGKQLTLDFGLGLIFLLSVMLTSIAIFSCGQLLALELGEIAILILLDFFLILSALTLLRMALNIVLYSYAVTGMLPNEFSPDLLPQRKST